MGNATHQPTHLPSFYPEWMREAFLAFEQPFDAFVQDYTQKFPDIQDDALFALFPGRRIRPVIYFGMWCTLFSAYHVLFIAFCKE